MRKAGAHGAQNHTHRLSSVPGFCLLGMVRPSMLSLCRSVTFAPHAASSSAMEPMTTSSVPSSLLQMGRGVPQYRLRLMFQSRASCDRREKSNVSDRVSG